MLSYILLFALIAIVILGVIRASKHSQPGGAPRPQQKEPFVGIAQNEIVDEIEMVGKPRVISRGQKPAPQVLVEDFEEEIQEDVVVIQQSRVINKKQPESVVVDASPLFAPKPAPQPSVAVEQDDAFNDVIVLHLISNPDHPYRGYELLQAMLTVGLRYGKWGIFHRHEEITGRGPILFSLASSVEPGTFDLAKMGSFSTPGLTLFMRVSSLENPPQAFETLLAAAKQLAEELGGTVCDEKRFPLAIEKLAWWRAQL